MSISATTAETNDFKPVHTLVSTPVTIVLTGGLLLIVLTGFFSFFYCGSFFKKLLTIWTHHRNRNRPSNLIQPSTPPERTGLDSKIIQSFPEFPYSVKDRGMDQCSICLLDFMDDDTMRLISTCNHFFHTICIDLWFELHKTCPVCRRELDLDRTSLEKPPVVPAEIDVVRSESHEEPLSSRDTLTIIVHEEHPASTTIGSLDQTDEIESYERRMKESNLRFWRSHSTGHSIIVKTENEQEVEQEKEEFKIHIEISGECQFEDHKRTLPNRNLYCVRGTYSVG